MLGRTAKSALKTRSGRRVGKAVAKEAIKAGRTRGGRGAAKSGARGMGKLVKTGAKLKAGQKAGKAGAKSAAKAGRGFGKVASKKGKREFRVAEKNLKSKRSGGGFLKYVLLAAAGLGIFVLLKRSGSQDSSSITDTSSSQTTGSGDGAGRAHSDPSSGPLIGEEHSGNVAGVTEDQPEIEQRIKTSIGEDERTRDMPRVNVEVNEGVAELRGSASSEEVKEAAGEIAAGIEGVSEVRNLIEVSS